MILTAQFKIDLIQLKHTADPEKLLQAYKDACATEFGKEVIKVFPFVKDDDRSFKGTVPEVSMNRDHEYMDLYESKLCVLEMEDVEELLHCLKNYAGDMYGAEDLIKKLGG